MIDRHGAGKVVWTVATWDGHAIAIIVRPLSLRRWLAQPDREGDRRRLC
jgi:hypothetical protein